LRRRELPPACCVVQLGWQQADYIFDGAPRVGLRVDRDGAGDVINVDDEAMPRHFLETRGIAGLFVRMQDAASALAVDTGQWLAADYEIVGLAAQFGECFAELDDVPD
jgi:hypothetical protein